MNYDKIFNGFMLFSALSGEEASEWAFLIYDCIDEFKSILKPQAYLSENSRRVTAAAAALANYRYRKILDSRGVLSGVRTSGLEIKNDERSLTAARDIYLERLAGISDLVLDRDFLFERMMPNIQTDN